MNYSDVLCNSVGAKMHSKHSLYQAATKDCLLRFNSNRHTILKAVAT